MIRSEGVRNRRDGNGLAQYVHAAATTLAAQGWKVLRRQDGPAAAWHVVARKGVKVRVVQVVVPATPATARQQRRVILGETARLPTGLGTMEQWLAHVRPDGQVRFGPYVLNAQRWAQPNEDALANLGLEA